MGEIAGSAIAEPGSPTVRAGHRPMTGAAILLVALGTAVACGRITRDVKVVPDPAAAVEQLWQEPADLERRNLYEGPGGPDLRPRDTTFIFVARDTSGWSPGFDVRSQDGVEWSVKLGPEAQSEVVSSRILWAIGFHQPPTYYLEQWMLTGVESGLQPAGRFRPTLPDQRVVGEWSWYENPFVGSRAFGGLTVANLILNSWDWKTSNNKIYEHDAPVNGVRRWFVVRDLGASLGRTTYPTMLKWFRLRGFGQGTRNDLDSFEAQGFITGIDEASRPEFDYRGIYRDVINTVSLADVRWTCSLLNRLSDAQWRDAFRAGGYNAEQTARYVTKIKAKIARGLEVGAG
jgi:hypothetical protein